MTLIGPLHDPITWYRISYAGRQITQWDFKSTRKSGWTGKSSFVLELISTALFASQHSLFHTMWPDRAKSLFINKR